jgi:class 3 adenylate cyclase/tetratricopeptide (TPR) repeat protein
MRARENMQSISQWLDALGLSQYADVFERNAVDVDLLGDLTDADLEKLGVHALGHRKKLLKAIDALRGADRVVPARSPDSYTPKHLAEKILTSKAALEGERKQVTVLFADLKGSMELLADRDPEEARKILDPVLERMMEAVHHYEGTVNQVMGDGIMALFGAPLAHEDHAVRACYAALRMQESLKRYAETMRRAHGVEVQIRVGLNSGDVVVRAIGGDLHMDYTAVGQTTHLAARMEQLAPPGSVRLTAETMRLAEGYVEVRSLGPIPVKGLLESIEVFELLGAGQARTRLQAAALRGLTRFVGRDAEVEHLRRVLTQADACRGQVVAIVGEAGVGKSRLTYEFTHSHRVQDWLILEASSVSYGKATSYLPVIDLLKGYFKIGNRDDHREMREKLTGKLFTLDESLRPILPAMLALLDVPIDDAAWQNLDPPQRRQRTLDAVKRLLLREAQVQPLLVVFEDLHWVDGETQTLLDNLVESLGSVRLLLLVNYRPEYEHRWGSKTVYSQLRLDSLPAESAKALLAALLGPDPGFAPLTQMLVKRGNPFFLEETLRTLVETGALAGERGAYRLTRPVDTLQIPASVQTILAARIDRLPPEEKQLLQAASVIGKDFSYSLLAAIAEQPDDLLRRGLAHLQEAEFVYETQLFPDLEYTFKHALTHEVTYGSLLQERRKTLHAQIVVAIERLYADRLNEQVERLAHNALRGQLWGKAVDYLRQAGVTAFERSANREAAGAFEQALLAIDHLPRTRDTIEQTVDLCLALRPCVTPLADMKRLLATVERAAPLIASLGNPRREALINGYRAAALTNLGRTQEALPFAMRGLSIAQSLDDPLLRVSSQFFAGQAHFRVGALRAAIEYFDYDVGLSTEKLIELAVDQSTGRTLDARSALSSHLFAKVECSSAYADLGAFDAAMQRAEEALRIAQCVELMYFRAQAEMAPGLQLGEDADFPGAMIHATYGLGHAYNLAQRPHDAVPILQRGWALAESGGFVHYGAICLTHLADAYSLIGRAPAAQETIDRALTVARDGGFRAREAWALHIQGTMLGRGSKTDTLTTQQAQHAALALAGELGMRPLVAHCHFGLGKLCARTGQREQATQHLATATTLYREMDMRFWLEQAEVEMRGPA